MSNRSHAYFKLGDFNAALADAERAIKSRPDWGKGYFRKGMALQALGKITKILPLAVLRPRSYMYLYPLCKFNKKFWIRMYKIIYT